MLEIHVDANPTLEQLKEFIIAVEKNALNDLRPFWVNVATPFIKEEMGRIFATQGYGRWPELSPRYAAYKRKYFPGKRILRREDVLYRATTRKGAGNIHIYEPDQMVWGVDLGYFASRFGFPYPAVHEKSGGNVPARPIFSTAEESAYLQANLAAGMRRYLEQKVEDESRRHFGRS